MSWLVVGISGITCGGKTTLSKSLYDYLSDADNKNCLSNNVSIGAVKMINQDAYFYPEHHPNHIWIDLINHVNFDVIGALDMNQMCTDLNTELGKRFTLYSKSKPTNIVNIMLIDGFTIFNHSVLNRICQLKFHIHLPYEKCYERRMLRTYEPPDVLGYFELCVWPMYEQNFNEIKNKDDIMLLNGDTTQEKLFSYVFNCMRDVI